MNKPESLAVNEGLEELRDYLQLRIHEANRTIARDVHIADMTHGLIKYRKWLDAINKVVLPQPENEVE